MNVKVKLTKVIGTTDYDSIIGREGELFIAFNDKVSFTINNVEKISTQIDMTKYQNVDPFLIFKDKKGISFGFKKI